MIYIRKNIICGIYCIENKINNKKYIGQSINIYDRWCKHKRDLNNNCHDNDYLQKSWNKYGKDNFIFYILEQCTPQELNNKECYYIEFYNTLNDKYGFNLMSGGSSDRHYSEASKIKISNGVKKSYLNPERIQKQKNNALKQWSNPEIKAKIMGANNGNYGNHLSEESKNKISMANKGRKSSRRNTTNVFCVELNKIFDDATTAGNELNLDGSAILKVCKHERKTCGGYHWEFVNLGNI